MRIQTLHNLDAPAIADEFYANIGKVHGITMSPVMDIHIRTPSGYRSAVLKVYDRRFGVDLRNIYRVHLPHTTESEAAFQSFVRSGKMGPFLDELARLKDESLLPFKPAYLLDDDDSPNYGPDCIARYEAALWQQTAEHFECETRAYRYLADLQGKSIPRVLAHICLMPEPGEVRGDQTMAPYLEVRGILLERNTGYNLSDLPFSPLGLQDPAAWSHIIQTAVDAAEVINRRGIRMEDCGPRKVIVHKDSQSPLIIDFAQCVFKEDLLEIWEGLRAEEKERFRDPFDKGDWVWDPEAEWWLQLAQVDNPGAIGSVMATIVRRDKGIELKFRYPEYAKMALDIRQRARKLDTRVLERKPDDQSNT